MPLSLIMATLPLVSSTWYLAGSQSDWSTHKVTFLTEDAPFGVKSNFAYPSSSPRYTILYWLLSCGTDLYGDATNDISGFFFAWALRVVMTTVWISPW